MTTHYQTTNTVDSVQVTSIVTEGSSTVTETPTPAFDAPWDVVTATAAGEGYAEGDYVFPLSDAGKEQLSSLFSEIESICGLPVRRRAARSAGDKWRRQSSTITECARDVIAESEVAAWDAGVSTSLVTITAFDAAVSVQGLSAAALVVLSAWVLGGGRVPEEEMPVLHTDAVFDLDDGLVSVGSGVEEPDSPGDTLAEGNSYFVASPDLVSQAASTRADWQRSTPFWIRKRLREWDQPEPTCQQSELWAPYSSELGEPPVSSSIISFCDDNNGHELTTDEPSKFSQYLLDDHAYWLVASRRDDEANSHCDYVWIDGGECREVFAYGTLQCDEEAKEIHGSEWYGECVKYTVTIDPSTDNTEPPSWEDANAGTPDDPEDPDNPPRDAITNNCVDPTVYSKFTVDQAMEAIADFCGHSEEELALPDAQLPVWKTYPMDDVTVQLYMQWSSSGQDGCNPHESGNSRVTQSDCSAQFIAAVNNCNTDTVTDKYGNMPMVWNSPNGCIDFNIYGDGADWDCNGLGVQPIQCRTLNSGTHLS